MALSPFETDTAVQPAGPGVWSGEMRAPWWVMLGPNGGTVAAVMLRAIEAAVDDASRRPRSLTVHYLRAPEAGPVQIEATLEREGRTLSSVSARLVQGDRLCCLALAAVATDRDGHELDDAAPPEVPPPDELDPPPEFLRGSGPAHATNFELRIAFGPPPFSGADEALSGGWIRLVDPTPIDAALLVQLSDAWYPALFSRTEGPGPVPTIDLTVHFRADPAGLPADGWLLLRSRTRLAIAGFLEEDVEIWAPDGRLLAQSRQLALAA